MVWSLLLFAISPHALIEIVLSFPFFSLFSIVLLNSKRFRFHVAIKDRMSLEHDPVPPLFPFFSLFFSFHRTSKRVPPFTRRCNFVSCQRDFCDACSAPLEIWITQYAWNGAGRTGVRPCSRYPNRCERRDKSINAEIVRLRWKKRCFLWTRHMHDFLFCFGWYENTGSLLVDSKAWLINDVSFSKQFIVWYANSQRGKPLKHCEASCNFVSRLFSLCRMNIPVRYWLLCGFQKRIFCRPLCLEIQNDILLSKEFQLFITCSITFHQRKVIELVKSELHIYLITPTYEFIWCN